MVLPEFTVPYYPNPSYTLGLEPRLRVESAKPVRAS